MFRKRKAKSEPGKMRLTMKQCKALESKLQQKVKRLSKEEKEDLTKYVNQTIERAKQTGTEPSASTTLTAIGAWFGKREASKKK
jgi:hypothetical protein